MKRIFVFIFLFPLCFFSQSNFGPPSNPTYGVVQTNIPQGYYDQANNLSSDLDYLLKLQVDGDTKRLITKKSLDSHHVFAWALHPLSRLYQEIVQRIWNTPNNLPLLEVRMGMLFHCLRSHYGSFQILSYCTEEYQDR